MISSLISSVILFQGVVNQNFSKYNKVTNVVLAINPMTELAFMKYRIAYNFQYVEKKKSALNF